MKSCTPHCSFSDYQVILSAPLFHIVLLWIPVLVWKFLSFWVQQIPEKYSSSANQLCWCRYWFRIILQSSSAEIWFPDVCRYLYRRSCSRSPARGHNCIQVSRGTHSAHGIDMQLSSPHRYFSWFFSWFRIDWSRMLNSIYWLSLRLALCSHIWICKSHRRWRMTLDHLHSWSWDITSCRWAEFLQKQ
jgi:hypothetical protein